MAVMWQTSVLFTFLPSWKSFEECAVVEPVLNGRVTLVCCQQAVIIVTMLYLELIRLYTCFFFKHLICILICLQTGHGLQLAARLLSLRLVSVWVSFLFERGWCIFLCYLCIGFSQHFRFHLPDCWDFTAVVSQFFTWYTV